MAAADARPPALALLVQHDVDGVAEVAVHLGHAVALSQVLLHPAHAPVAWTSSQAGRGHGSRHDCVVRVLVHSWQHLWPCVWDACLPDLSLANEVMQQDTASS
jgi:hypothetical protein